MKYLHISYRKSSIHSRSLWRTNTIVFAPLLYYALPPGELNRGFTATYDLLDAIISCSEDQKNQLCHLPAILLLIQRMKLLTRANTVKWSVLHWECPQLTAPRKTYFPPSLHTKGPPLSPWKEERRKKWFGYSYDFFSLRKYSDCLFTVKIIIWWNFCPHNIIPPHSIPFGNWIVKNCRCIQF